MYPVLFTIFGYEVSSWSVMVILGVCCLVPIYFYRLRKIGCSEQTIDRLTIITSIGGLFTYLGASFFDSLWHSISDCMEKGIPFKFDWGAGGVTFEGGIITGMIVFFILFPLGMKHDKRNSLFYMDQLVIGILIAHAFGRIGCFLGGCCYGKVTDSFLGIYYPPAGAKVYPTQLYEALFLLICFVIFFFFVKKHQTEKYLISYGVFRFLLEYLRGDDRGASPFGFLSPSQFLSIVMIVAGIACIFIRRAIYKKDLKEFNNNPDTSKEKVLRYYSASYKGLLKGVFTKCECPICKSKMKLKMHGEFVDVNDLELMRKDHLVYICKKCNVEQELNGDIIETE